MTTYLTDKEYDELNLLNEQIEMIERYGYCILDEINLSEYQREYIENKIKNNN